MYKCHSHPVEVPKVRYGVHRRAGGQRLDHTLRGYGRVLAQVVVRIQVHDQYLR